MSYSLEKLPNKPYEIPAPPPYAVWVESIEYTYHPETKEHTAKRTGAGQVRHVPSLAKAKARVSTYTRGWRIEDTDPGKFACDWTIYLWNAKGNEYEAIYEGRAGESRNLNHLFTTKLKKDYKDPRPGFENEVESALQSIMEAVK